jgi:hypothetical protein
VRRIADIYEANRVLLTTSDQLYYTLSHEAAERKVRELGALLSEARR